MRFIKTCRLIFLLPLIAGPIHSSTAPFAQIFLLRESIAGVEMEKIEISGGEVKTFNGEDVITVVIPLGIGQAGDLVKRGMRSGTITVRSDAGELHISKRYADGKEMAYPVVRIEDLSAYDVRVNVAGGGGFKRAFMIRRYEEAEEDGGPVIDMFAGMIPLEDGDYSITLEISAAEAAAGVSGETAIFYEDGFLLAEGSLQDGRSGYFIVDFGASGTLLTKDFLPAYVEIEEVRGLEYSERGRREVKSAMSGAGGDVTGFLGNASPGDLIFGNVRFSDVTVNVVESMPDFGTRKVVGILGLDLMKRCDRISFEYPPGGPGVMMMGGRPALAETDAPSAEVPFSLAAKHIFLDGEVNEVPVSFLLDTGARNSILSASIAEEAGLKERDDGEKGELRGLDGNPVESRPVIAERLRLGDWLRSDVPFLAADLSVFESIGLRRGGGLIGNDFLDDYSLVEIEFERNIISLWK